MINDKSESNRITLAFGFVTFFVALFFGADYLVKSENVFLQGLRVYAFFSSSLFFFYLLFTGILFKYRLEKDHVKLGFGSFGFTLTRGQIVKFREWAFNTGLNCIFVAFFLPFFNALFEFTDSIKTIPAVVLIMLTFYLFESTLNCFFRMLFGRTILFFLLASAFFIIIRVLNQSSEQFLNGMNTSEIQSLFLKWIAGENIF